MPYQISNNKQLIEAYSMVVGLNNHFNHVRKQILGCGHDIPAYYAQHGNIEGIPVKVNKEVRSILEKLVSGELDAEKERTARIESENDKRRSIGKLYPKYHPLS